MPGMESMANLGTRQRPALPDVTLPLYHQVKFGKACMARVLCVLLKDRCSHRRSESFVFASQTHVASLTYSSLQSFSPHCQCLLYSIKKLGQEIKCDSLGCVSVMPRFMYRPSGSMPKARWNLATDKYRSIFCLEPLRGIKDHVILYQYDAAKWILIPFMLRSVSAAQRAKQPFIPQSFDSVGVKSERRSSCEAEWSDLHINSVIPFALFFFIIHFSSSNPPLQSPYF
jgi:hypothetical protein